MIKRKNKNGIFYVAISLMVILAVGAVGIVRVGRAQVAKSDLVELTEFASALNGDVGAFKVGLAYLGDKMGLNLGASPGGDFFSPVIFYDTFGYHNGKNETRYFYKTVSFTNGTSTLAIFDPDSEGYNDFYLVNMWLTNDEKATSTTRMAVTTSTATVIAQDDAAILNEDNGAATLM